MTTPTLTEAIDRLAGAIPAKPEWAGSVSVDSRDLEAVTSALTVDRGAVLATTFDTTLPGEGIAPGQYPAAGQRATIQFENGVEYPILIGDIAELDDSEDAS